MIDLDAGTVLLQWATGGLFFFWVTARRRVVGLGYGWLLRSVYGVIAVGSFAAGSAIGGHPERDAVAMAVAAVALGLVGASFVHRREGLDAVHPHMDLIAPVFGLVGLVLASVDTGGPVALSLARTLVGALFLGAVTDAMLLGHWYLVQPGLSRAPLLELNKLVAIVWPFEIATLLWPVGMFSVFSGSIDDGYSGVLGYFWIACAITTIALCAVTAAALRERSYSAVMAATGLLYLAILTAFGTDLVAKAVLAGA
ncbi:MAG TPA: hypothetical protein VM030_02030 [Acidimicrobiales bacterium]|nr:hypothetical protein [Acidimicrobiales bacterium]